MRATAELALAAAATLACLAGLGYLAFGPVFESEGVSTEGRLLSRDSYGLVEEGVHPLVGTVLGLVVVAALAVTFSAYQHVVGRRPLAQYALWASTAVLVLSAAAMFITIGWAWMPGAILASLACLVGPAHVSVEDG